MMRGDRYLVWGKGDRVLGVVGRSLFDDVGKGDRVCGVVWGDQAANFV
jgi:hypothetical protein